MKNEPVPEICVTSNNSAGTRSVVAGLRLGCVPVAVEVGRYTGTPTKRESIGCMAQGRWRIRIILPHPFYLTVMYQTETIHALLTPY